MENIKILGIETSCDETAIAIVEGKLITGKPKLTILSNIISSQIDLHAKYGGVVPEVASRAHMENIVPAMKAALKSHELKARSSKLLALSQIDAIAVTCGPGLIGSLLVGVNFAKALAYATAKPIIPINHLEGHIYANFVGEKSKVKSQKSKIEFPVLCLIVSGGHTSLVLMKKHLKYQVVGETWDDAAGEAFDKVGKLLELPYPGGPNIEKVAKSGNPKSFKFPRALMGKNNFNFSFSGLKTAVLYEIRNISKLKAPATAFASAGRQGLKLKADIAASFQEAVIDVLVEKTMSAARKYQVKTIMLAGGVAANQNLKDRLRAQSSGFGVNFAVPPAKLCTDNAAMIAATGYFYGLKNDFTPWQKINADANLKLK